jgi:two-component system, sensor histidine kinase and response regulator
VSVIIVTNRSLRIRSVLTLAAALLAGVAALVLGARHLTHAQGGAAFARDVWITIGLVALCANVSAIVAIVASMRRLHGAVTHARTAVLELARETAVAPADDAAWQAPEEFCALHAAIDDTRTQLALARSRVRMDADRTRAIIDGVFASVFSVDGGGRIISANQAAIRMFALPVGTLEGVVLSDLIAADSLRMAVDELGSVTFTDSGTAHRFTTQIRIFGRRAFPADVSVTPLVLDGQHAWAVFVHDLTEKHQVQLELADARIAAVASNRARTAFLVRMSRELRTPLNAMIGFTKVVRRSRSSQLSDRDRHYVDRVQAGSEHLLELVSDILDLSRIESGTIELRPETTDISPIVREIIGHHESRVADRPVVLDADLPDAPALAAVDTARLRQLLTNLIGNAVKFTARGSIQVSVRLDHETGLASAIIVRDTGIGIPLERQSYIFDSFEQGGEETSHRYGGSGLGLALSRRIAQQMGCMLSVESMPGAGSTFTLAFSHADAMTAPLSILLQDDAA